MTDKNQLLLLLLLWAVWLARDRAYAGGPASDRQQHSKPSIACGTPRGLPTNVTRPAGDHVTAGLFTRGAHSRCRSQLVKKGQSYVHMIYDVFNRDCGGKISMEKNLYEIVVYLRYPRYNRTQEKERHTLSCHYDKLNSKLLPSNWRTEKANTRQIITSHREPPPQPAPRIPRKKRSGKKTEMSSFSVQRELPRLTETLQEGQTTMMPEPSLLQLNVINEDGNMTTVVHSARLVALELHTAHHTSLGVPMVNECRIGDPLVGVHNGHQDLFSRTIMRYGCGLGDFLPQDRGFIKGKRGYTTPFFSVPVSWTQQAALVFSCDVIICFDVKNCKQSCPAKSQNAIKLGPHDLTVVLESQVVTSCPSADDLHGFDNVDWSGSFLPECLPEGFRLSKALPPKEPDQNFTTSVPVMDDVTKFSSKSSWLAGHLHYLIIIAVLALLIVVFMFATFCKMVAMQRQVLHGCNKLPSGLPRERTSSELHDQTTQTPRPLPRVPKARGHNPGRHSRQGGDGAPTTLVHVDGGLVESRLLVGAQLAPPEDSHQHPQVIPYPQVRASAQTRPKPYDVPPPCDRPREARPTSETTSSPCQSPLLYEDSQRSSEVKSIQTSTTVEQKNTERHTTIIEIKTPAEQDDRDGSIAWKTQDKGSSPNNNALERGVVLGVNSLRRHQDREHALLISGKARDRRPVSLPHHEPVMAKVYYNTPAPCSEDSLQKELYRTSFDGSSTEHTQLAGIRTSPYSINRRGITPIAVNSVEESTRL